MRSTSARGTRLAPVDDEVRIRPIDAGERRDNMLLEERILRVQIQRERSSAYWFAATKWGMAGLIIGVLVGGAAVYFTTLAALPIAQSGLERAQIMEHARQQLEDGAFSPGEQPNSPRPAD
jgi:hypothetical protein